MSRVPETEDSTRTRPACGHGLCRLAGVPWGEHERLSCWQDVRSPRLMRINLVIVVW